MLENRFFEFFDKQNTGRVTLKDVLRGATQAHPHPAQSHSRERSVQVVGVSGGLQGQLEFMFHLFDVHNKGSFTHADAAALLEGFALLFVELSSNVISALPLTGDSCRVHQVFSMERPFLAANGTSESQLNTHLDQIRSILPNLSQVRISCFLCSRFLLCGRLKQTNVCVCAVDCR